MGYQCGIGPGFGIPPREPGLTCDVCGFRQSVQNRNGDVSQLWLTKRTLNGWKSRRTEHEDGSVERYDLCPTCKEKASAAE